MGKIVKDKLPDTNCKFKRENRVVACDDYIQKDGNFDFQCCQSCGWNPEVAQKRIIERSIRIAYEKEMEKRRAKYGLT